MYTNCTCLDPNCTTTIKLVLELMDSVHLLDKVHCMYMENFYISPEIYEELIFHSMYECGTVHPNKKGLPKAVITAKLKKMEAVFRHICPLLAIRWCDKRVITVLTTIHPTVHVETNKTDAQGIEFQNP